MTEEQIKKDPIDWKIVFVAILCLTILEIVAMFQGINGRLFSFVLVIIAGLAGLSLPQMKFGAH